MGLRSRGSYWEDRGFLSGGELERSRYLKGRPHGAVIVICMLSCDQNGLEFDSRNGERGPRMNPSF